MGQAKHHRVVKGASLLTLYYTDVQGRSLPVNYRVCDKADNKSKNDYFQDMRAAVLAWGLRPAFATGDTWYACEKNPKTVKNHRMGLMFAVAANRTVSLEKGRWVQVQKLNVPDEGLMVWLRNFGPVILNHLFAELCSFVQWQEMQFTHAIVNAYQWKTELFTEVVAAFVTGFIPGKEHLGPQFRAVVNA